MSEKGSPNSARERLKESLSVSLDGQASELELRRVLGGISNDDSLRALAGRYRLIGDAVRGDVSKFAGVDISRGVLAAIEQDESSPAQSTNVTAEVNDRAANSPKGSLAQRFWTSLGKMAVAASVAAAVIIGVRTSNLTPKAPLLAEHEPAVLSQPIQIAQSGLNDYGAASVRAGNNSESRDNITPEQLAFAQKLANQATRERFRAYALQHAELSAVGGAQSVLSFARLTSFDNQ